MKYNKRETLYELVMSQGFHSSINNQKLLLELQKQNLLCDNEVEYYKKPEYKNISQEELYNHIQKRVAYHRGEELKIKNSYIKKGGFTKLANGSRVQGTTIVGGLQPDYIVDTTSKEIQKFMKAVSGLKNKNKEEIISQVGVILRQDFIEKTQYQDPQYLNLMKRYKDDELEIPLSEYLKINRGVCREISMLTTLALNYLGLESYYYYAKVRTDFGISKEEDHAVVAINIDNQFLLSDNYFRAFNNKSLSQLEKPEGIKCLSGLMYDDIKHSVEGRASIILSRLYPETRHNSRHI